MFAMENVLKAVNEEIVRLKAARALLADTKEPVTKKRKGMSAETRKRMGRAQKKRRAQTSRI